jgi:hypothetical protein
MNERIKRDWRGDWNGNLGALLDAAEAAMDAGPLDGSLVEVVEVHWADTEGSYNVAEARDRLKQSQPPERMAIYIADGKKTDWHAHIAISLIKWDVMKVSVHASGSDWPRTHRAYEAALRIIQEHATEPSNTPGPENTPEATGGSGPDAAEVPYRLVPVKAPKWRASPDPPLSPIEWIEAHPVITGLAGTVLLAIVGIIALIH